MTHYQLENINSELVLLTTNINNFEKGKLLVTTSKANTEKESNDQIVSNETFVSNQL